MRSLLVDTLEDAGEYPEIDDLGNVVVSRGDEDGTHILLNTHIDTVPPHLPYERRTEPPGPDETIDGTGGDGDGDIVCGRGACDAKGPLAALLDAFLTVTPDDGGSHCRFLPTRRRHRPAAHTSLTPSTPTATSSASRLASMCVRPPAASSRGRSPSTARVPTPPTPAATTTRSNLSCEIIFASYEEKIANTQ